MKKLLTSLFQWSTWTDLAEIHLAAKVLTWKKRLNPITNKIGFGIYFFKNITINLNRINKEILEIAEDRATLSYFNKTEFPHFISVSDGIHATMFSELPTHVTERITSLVHGLPGYKALQSAIRAYGYKCELHYNQGKIFFGSLQIHFVKIHHQALVSV
ncbi:MULTISPECIES: hypothetical protein [unclassified Paenibacillus]|uniref:hypothetical protein n=1 Tax=unclassified Paenibacillus TaxID=185978 RepID=UPI001AEB133C|nr:MULTISPECIES: hypothetical protein [unclassified Paenibacillus]MBP1155101.1 hypothetical protein [Paenibacillus sp. PvP091]MBP1169515.1 hypothetical protein [Paenibacillus sp. PvR098]MBP2440543.1 hypothetical protein [Paenibacillus sp. PvP052]